MFVDILMELNKLNKIFQFVHVDITYIGGNLNICITILTHLFLFQRSEAFGRGTMFPKLFLRNVWSFLVDGVSSCRWDIKSLSSS
jgi:hypothetical protein